MYCSYIFPMLPATNCHDSKCPVQDYITAAANMQFNLKPAVERGAEAQLIQPSGVTQKPQLTHRVSLDFCASPSS